MTEDEFIDKYEPERDKEGNVYVQRELPEDRRRINKAIKERRLWTMMEEDDELFIVSGYHYVNRLYYIICRKPYGRKELSVKCDI